MIRKLYTIAENGDLNQTDAINEIVWDERQVPSIKVQYSVPAGHKIITWGEFEELQELDLESRKLFYQIYEGGRIYGN